MSPDFSIGSFCLFPVSSFARFAANSKASAGSVLDLLSTGDKPEIVSAKVGGQLSSPSKLWLEDREGKAWSFCSEEDEEDTEAFVKEASSKSLWFVFIWKQTRTVTRTRLSRKMVYLKLNQNPVTDAQLEKRKLLEKKLKADILDLEMLEKSLHLTKDATYRITSIMNTFDGRLARLESYIMPIHTSTNIQSRTNNSNTPRLNRRS